MTPPPEPQQPMTEAKRTASNNWMPAPTERDWQEDFSHKNGKYYGQCRLCGEKFMGHKRRVWCKLCFNTPREPDAEEKRDGDYMLLTNLAEYIRQEGLAIGISRDAAGRVYAIRDSHAALTAEVEENRRAKEALGYYIEWKQQAANTLKQLSDRIDEFTYGELASILEDGTDFEEDYKSKSEQLTAEVERYRKAMVSIKATLTNGYSAGDDYESESFSTGAVREVYQIASQALGETT